MDVASTLRLSYYQKISDISAEHGVYLVKHRENGHFYVQKDLGIYNTEVFRSLLNRPVPHTPVIRELIEGEGTLTIIEEFIPGATLSELLRSGPLPAERARDYMLQLCEAVGNLHERTPALIHRDIKPSNIMITEQGSLLLLDFNAARFATGEKDGDTVLLGTSGYAAPEQYGFRETDARADIYAMGVVLRAMLTGDPEKPYTGGSFEKIIDRCTKMDPEDRFPSVKALAEEIRRNRPKNYRRLLPPGFRSGSPLHMLIGLAGYAAAAAVSFSNSSPDTPPPSFISSLFLLFGCLSVIFISANYCGIQDRLPLCRSRYPGLRLLGILLADGMAVVLMAALAVIAESILLPG